MAQDAELARCIDGLTGHRRELQDVYDWFAQGEREGFITHSARVVGWMREHDARRYRHLCGAELLINRFRTECFQLDEPEWDYWHWTPYWPAYRCDPPQCRYPREYLAIPGGIWPHLCHSRAADPGCIYAICSQRGVCIYPSADGSRCSLIVRGEP